jgi:anti-sigma factor RsiW
MSEPRTFTEADLQAYVDGRLGEPRKSEVEAWLAGRPEEAERVAAYRELGEDVRATYDPLLAEPVPRSMRHWPRRGSLQGFGIAASWLLAAALGAFAGWQLHAMRATPAPAADMAVMARRAAIAHATYSPEVRHPVEVGADQEQHLVAWLSKRLGVKVQAPKLDAAGMSLVGGRLLPGDNGGPVALFMYQTQAGRRLTLYVHAEAARNRETAFRYTRENSVSVFYWIDRDRGYALASADLDKEELLRVAMLVYKQLEP